MSVPTSTTPRNPTPRETPLQSSPDWLASRVPFFYGWLILPIATLAHVMATPGQSYGVSSFISEFRRDLQLSDAQVGGAYMIGTLLGCLPVWLFGSALDRFGPRRTSAVIIVGLGFSCFLTAFVFDLTTLTIALFLLRTLANGAMALVAQNMIAMWFRERLGLAMGVYQVGVCASLAFAPYVASSLLDCYGWRESYLIMGMTIWLVVLPLLAIVSRDRPEDVGQQPDGDFPAQRLAAETSLDVHEVHGDFTAAEAMRSWPYWIILFAQATWTLVGTGAVLHLFSVLGEQGLSREEAAPAFLTFGITMAVGNLVGGWIVDYGRMNRVMAVGLLMMGAANVVLLNASSSFDALLFGFLFGGGQGLSSSVAQSALGKYFGRSHLGAIRGSSWTAVIAGSAVGPFLMGLSKEHLSDFGPSLVVFASSLTVLAVVAWWGLPEREALRAVLFARRRARREATERLDESAEETPVAA